MEFSLGLYIARPLSVSGTPPSPPTLSASISDHLGVFSGARSHVWKPFEKILFTRAKLRNASELRTSMGARKCHSENGIVTHRFLPHQIHTVRLPFNNRTWQFSLLIVTISHSGMQILTATFFDLDSSFPMVFFHILSCNIFFRLVDQGSASLAYLTFVLIPALTLVASTSIPPCVKLTLVLNCQHLSFT